MLTYDVAGRGELSLYEYLYRRIRQDIESAALPPHERLPSKRALARHLGISLVTVEGAYSQLLAEGYVRSEPRRGYYVTELPGKARPGEVRMGETRSRDDVRSGDVGPGGVSSGDAGLGGTRSDGVHSREDVRSLDAASGGFEAADGGAPGVQDATDGQDAPGGQAVMGAPATAGGRGTPDGQDATGANGARGSGGQTQARSAEAGGGVDTPGRRALVADFSRGMAARDDGAYQLWARAVRATLSRESERSLFAQLSPKGSVRLREAIAAHLRGLRGMDVEPSRIVVGAGAEYLYGLIVQIAGRGRGYAIEDPGYPRLASIYEANGARVSRVALDAQGMDVAALRESGAGVAHVMPSHQFPTGIVTSAARRYELLGWAAEAARFIVEDDYDCEFRLAGRPVPSLQSIDAFGTVLYLNTFSKSLSPALRVAYLVLPGELAERFDSEFDFYSSTVATPTQLTLARILETGAYERHISRIKTRHRAIRDALVGALRACEVAGRLHVENDDAGLHFVLGVETGKSEGEIVADALRGGVRLAPLSDFWAAGGRGVGGRGVGGRLAAGGRPEGGGHGGDAWPAVVGARGGSRQDSAVGQGEPDAHAPRRLARFVMQYGSVDVDRIPEIVEILARAFS